MIRGAIILAVGFGLGYAKAMSEQEVLAGTAKELFAELKKFSEEQKRKARSDDSPEEAVVDDPTPNDEQGETP